MGDTLKPSRCRDCGKVEGHYQWCGVKHLDGDKTAEELGLSAVVADLRERHPEVEAKPVWQKPSFAGSYNVISSPAHYARFAIQPIDFIEANGLDFLQASVLKYLVRFPYKNGVEDLHKARDMLNRLIKREERKAGMADPLAPVDDYDKVVERLVGDTRKDVGSHPAPEYTEGCTDRGGGSQ